MTLAPLDFSFPSAAIVKMEVDQRRIGVEGLEFGVVKTEMALELEVTGTEMWRSCNGDGGFWPRLRGSWW